MSLGEFFWTLLVIYAMFFYFMILFRVVGDLFSDKDASGIKKTVWIIALILLPFISLFVYLIVNGSAMNQRALDRAREIDQAQQAYIREAAGSGGSDPATQIEKAHQLLASGAISQAEFDSIKSKALSAG
ncbi:MAG TPA: SHOCT domain-containing protein [Candidatus Nanopelagicales bacterium]|jgi:hypothetical protein|nr:SHOCT domain-containing protein [Candidatus Nanopelagicales bacterium]